MSDTEPDSAIGNSPSRRMQILYNSVHAGHVTGMHPESKKRLDAFTGLPETPLFDGRPYLDLIHTSAYIRRVEESCRRGGHIDQDTVVGPGSWDAALYAVGATIQAAETGGFALVRPPGHHAHADHASGFCLFNNVAIAARFLVEQGKRVLIFDFDGHLGDGTSAIFYDTDEVMYWSVHQYPAFPGHGFVDEIGSGAGEGYNIMLPLPAGSADDIFLDAVRMSLPIVKQFQPDVVALSAGFDAHEYDLLLDLKVSTEGFFKLGTLIAREFPTFFATLEGGYNVLENKRCVESFLAGVNGESNPPPAEPTLSGMRIHETYEINLHAALGRLRTYWSM